MSENQSPQSQASESPSQVQAVQAAVPAQPQQGGKGKSRLWRVISVVLVLGVLACAGYLIVPQMAQARVEIEQSLAASRQQLSDALVAQTKLAKEVGGLEAELSMAHQQAEQSAGQVLAVEAELNQAKGRVVELTGQVERARQTSAPLVEKLQGAHLALADAESKVQAFQGRTDELAGELASVRESAKDLSARHEQAVAANSKLTKGIEAQREAAGQFQRLLAALELGSGEAPAVVGDDADKPVTRSELIGRLGQPTISFGSCDELTMQWGAEHTALAVNDVVATIDGQPATRGVLRQLAPAGGDWAAPLGSWWTGGATVQYADLVGLLGAPEGLSGTGRQFTAWWPVGAWAGTASATVVDGLVTEFAGGEPDWSAICELVRHRSQAYDSETAAVRDGVRDARGAYERASRLIAERMAEDARIPARDGMKLVGVDVAAFDSAGVWIAPRAADGAMVVRALVRCAWRNADGARTVVPQFVIVTLTGGPDECKLAEYAVLTPGG
jgi:hypothetical protein